MTTQTPSRKTQWQNFVAHEHFRYHHPGALPAFFTNGTHLVVDAQMTPLLEQTLADFQFFCAQCLGIDLVMSQGKGAICLRLIDQSAGEYNVLDPSGETFALTITKDGILLEAAHERGLLHGTHYLERLLVDGGLLMGRWERTPVFSPRITSLMGVDDEHLDARLSLMSHFGANGIHTGVDLWEYTRNGIIPELNGPEADQRVAALNARAERLRRHGLDLYLYVNNTPLPADHPAFLADPSRRGAPYRVYEDMAVQHVLCSGNEEVQAACAAAVEDLFRSVTAAGAILLVGGEGLMHCYSRPYGAFDGYTSCPHCTDREPSVAVANLVNRAAAAVKRTGAHKVVFTWPYSAFTWSGDDRAQLRWIEHLDDTVQVLSNFDTGSEDTRNNAGVVLYDYNIKSIGPSQTFQAQAAKLTGMGRRIYAKTESNVTPTCFFTAYIPVHFRWHRRFREMARAGVAGYMNLWYFAGICGTPPEEMQYHAIWNPNTPTEELLANIARRDFKLPAADAAQAVEAWRLMSEAWDDFPYSAMTAGEREFYARGPMHIGPAHPLIFNPQSRYGLPPRFFGLPVDFAELATPEEIEALWRDAKPRYVSELLLTLPYGVERYLELTRACREKWAEGVRMLADVLGESPADRGRMELDVCETFAIHLTTLEHVVRFYTARERLWRTSVSLPDFREILEELKAILQAEMANAERILPILTRDTRIRTYDEDMVRAKLQQCRYVLEEELPLFDSTVRFHVWNSYP